MRKHKKHIREALGSRAPQGRRLGDDRLEVLVLLVALVNSLASTGTEQQYSVPKKDKRKKSREGKCEYTTCTQQV